jgi:F420-non-reducing hydrogenase iron-sulfur subunit
MDIRVHVCRNALIGDSAAAVLQRLQTMPHVAVELVPCSGKIDPRYLLKALEAGASTVCVLACPAGECQSIEGNLRLIRRVEAVRELASEAGLDPGALRIFLPQGPGERAAEAAMDSLERFVRAALIPAQRMVA